MPYPPAPWKLQGYAIQTLHLVNIDRVRSLIPAELKIISVWPGQTLGGVYFANYQSSSVSQYSELIVAPVVVSYRGKIGTWVSHIYVDNADSLSGGREIWGLPKELADFTWEKSDRVTVRQGNRNLCTLNYKPQTLAWRQRLSMSTFSTLGADLVRFPAECESLLGLVGCQLVVPTESPFSGLGLSQPFLTARLEQLHGWVGNSKVVAQLANPVNRIFEQSS